MVPLMTLKGIDQAISNLKFRNRKALKPRLVDLIRQSYTDESSVESTASIDDDELVKILWDTGSDYDSVKRRKKNFNSVKSSLNADLKKLYQQGKNPEGIMIGPDNTFIMSEEAKDRILEKYGFDMEPDGSFSLDQMAKMLKMVHETLSDSILTQDADSVDGLKKLNKLKDQLQGLSEKIDLAGSGAIQTDSESTRVQLADGSPRSEDFKGGTEHSQKLGVEDDIGSFGSGKGSGKQDLQVGTADEGGSAGDAAVDTDGQDSLPSAEAESPDARPGGDTEDVEEVDDLAEEEDVEEVEEGEDFGEKETFETLEEVDEAAATAEALKEDELAEGQDSLQDGEIAEGSDKTGAEDEVGGTDDLEEDEEVIDDLEEIDDLAEEEAVEDFKETDDLAADEVVEEVEEVDDLADDEIVEDFEETDDLADDEVVEDFEEADGLADDEVVEDFEEVGDLAEEEVDEELEDSEAEEVLATAEASEADKATEGEEALQDGLMDAGDDKPGTTDEMGEAGAGKQEVSQNLQDGGADGDDSVGGEVGEDVEKIDELDDEVVEDLEEADDLVDDEVVEDLEEADELDDEVAEDLEEVDELDDHEVAEDLEEVDELADDEVGEDVEESDDLANDEVGEDLEESDELADDEVGEDVEEADELADDEVVKDLEEVDELDDHEVVEDLEEADELDDEVVEDLEEIDELDDEVVEDLEEADELDDHEVAEDLEEADDFEEDVTLEVAEDSEEDIEAEWADDVGLPADSLGQEYSEEVSDKIKKARLLAEEFDGYLGVMDRYFNQYLLIPEGEYIIGSRQPRNGEKFVKKVSLTPFYMGRFPITNGLFEIFAEKTGYKTYAEKVGYGTVYYGRIQKKKDVSTGLITSTWNSSLHCETVEGACWYQPSGPGSTLHNKRAHPVVQITIEDAMAFAAWTGKRLPTEEEWEAAARTANGWVYPWGQEWHKNSCNLEDSSIGDTTPVDRYVEFENDLGIADTMGNILEWTLYNLEAVPDKDNRSKDYVAKGGSWISGNDVALYNCFKLEPESHSNILGFRCVAY